MTANLSVADENGTEKIQRKLAAIMFTDIFQYSRLMSHDEQKAVRMLSDHDAITERVISTFKGRILKRMGDAVFAEFGSSVDALRCAIRIQEELGEYNSGKDQGDRILVRIGLHEGDVIVRGDDLFGEGVNVAARLEPMADPGGICISESLYRSVQSTTKVEALKVGDVELKNILQKYTIYKIPSPFAYALPAETKKPLKEETGRGYRIKKVIPLPVKFLSPVELGVASVLFFALCVAVLFYAVTGSFKVRDLLEFINENKIAMAGLPAALVLMTVYFYSAKAIRVVFDDIRGVDELLDFLAAQIGYSRHLEEGNMVVLKPSLYHFVMYSARKIRAVFDGNAVVLTGNTMYVYKLMKVLKSFETVG